jgi:type II secretory pathway pseudopilin PulG
MRPSRRAASIQGFALIEALIAVAIFVAIAAGIAQLIAVSARAVRSSREQTTAVVLAAAKIDQLRSLAWTYEWSASGFAAVPRSDRTTDVSHPGLAAGGAGLQASSPAALVTNTTNYVDYLDGSGRWVGHDNDPPADAVYVRRWSVRSLPDAPERTLVLQVLVATVRDDRSRLTPWSRRTGTEALLVSVRTRTGQ